MCVTVLLSVCEGISMDVSQCVYMYVSVCGYLSAQRPENGMESPGDKITGHLL